jgi:hypothetical protein
MAQILMSCPPSFSETFPANRASPFLGVCLYFLISRTIVSIASITAVRVYLDLIFSAVEASASSCFDTA